MLHYVIQILVCGILPPLSPSWDAGVKAAELPYLEYRDIGRQCKETAIFLRSSSSFKCITSIYLCTSVHALYLQNQTISFTGYHLSFTSFHLLRSLLPKILSPTYHKVFAFQHCSGSVNISYGFADRQSSVPDPGDQLIMDPAGCGCRYGNGSYLEFFVAIEKICCQTCSNSKSLNFIQYWLFDKISMIRIWLRNSEYRIRIQEAK
jgi:hypothetical protein